MNKKVILSLVMVCVLAFGAGLGTFAWFTSTAVSSNNIFDAGTLKLGIEGNYALDLGTVGRKLAPGDTTNPVIVTIENTGDLDLGWFGRFDISSATDNAKLAEAIYIKEAQMEFLNPTSGKWEPTDKFITNGTGSGPYPKAYTDLANADPLKVVTLKSFNEAGIMGVGKGVMKGALEKGYKYRFSFQLGMAPLADNKYQGDKVEDLNLTYRVVATQVNADALAALDAADPVIDINSPAENLSWMQAQIDHQGVVDLQ
ncbi:MAG TPA: TasA family protein [Candidatus Nitrosocosmicus sp.]|nr:TasA family protein [Candidatus Nitrosocosmicus sp.]